MAVQSKRMKNILEKYDKQRMYSSNEAFCILKKLSTVKFIESVDISVNLGVDPRKSDQVVRGASILPNGIGKIVRIAVFTQGENIDKAKKAGADFVGMEDLADYIKNKEIIFDVVMATPDAMNVVGQLGKILGPKGQMPSSKLETVTDDIESSIKNVKSGQVRYRTDKVGIIHTIIGKINFEVRDLQKNLKTILLDLKKIKPVSSKGVYIKKITVSSTMGPGLILDIASLET